MSLYVRLLYNFKPPYCPHNAETICFTGKCAAECIVEYDMDLPQHDNIFQQGEENEDDADAHPDVERRHVAHSRGALSGI